MRVQQTKVSESNDFPVEGHYSFIIDVHGFPLKVTYQSDPFNNNEAMNMDLIRFEFRGKTASTTGYKSHFDYLSHINTTPYGFALYASKQLYKEVKAVNPEQLQSQLSLF